MSLARNGVELCNAACTTMQVASFIAACFWCFWFVIVSMEP